MNRDEAIENWGRAERDKRCLIAALKALVRSANPNKQEHPAMFEAWARAKDLLLQPFCADAATAPNEWPRGKNGTTLATGDILRMPFNEKRAVPGSPINRFRVWRVTNIHFGATNQESTYALEPLDLLGNEPIRVPFAILQACEGLELVGS